MDSEQFLAQLEPLAHAQRVRAILDLVKHADGQAVIAQLAQGGPYERYLALHSIYTTRDQALLGLLLRDQAQLVRITAIHLASLFADDQLLLETLQQFNHPDRERLLLALRRTKRFTVIDAWLATLDTLQLEYYAPFASPHYIGQIPNDVFEHLELSTWRRMARWHPKHTLVMFELMLKQIRLLDSRMIQRISSVFRQLIELHPHEAMQLLERAWPKLPTELRSSFGYFSNSNEFALEKAQHFQPNAMYEFLLKRSALLVLLLAPRRLGKLSADVLIKLWDSDLLSKSSVSHLSEWHKVKADTVHTLYQHSLYKETIQRWLHPAFVALLPAETRMREVYRHLNDQGLQDYRDQLKYLELLPYEQACAEIVQRIDLQRSEEQAASIFTRLRILRREQRYQEFFVLAEDQLAERTQHLGDLLQTILALPPQAWQAQHLAQIESVFRRGMIHTPDLLPAIAQRLLRQLFSLPEWSAQQLAWVLPLIEQGHASQVWQQLNAQQAQALDRWWVPLVLTWTPNSIGASQTALLLAVQAKRLMRHMPNLRNILQTSLLQNNEAHELEKNYLATLLTDEPSENDLFLAKLLAQAPQWLLHKPVLQRLQRRNPQLLLDTLRNKLPLSHDMPPFALSFATWNPQQQNILYNYLTQKQFTGKALLHAMKTIVKLYAVEPQFVLDFPYAEGMYEGLFLHENPYLWAMQALGRADTPAAMPTIRRSLTNLYSPLSLDAFEHQVMRHSPSEAFAILSDIPTEPSELTIDWLRLIARQRSTQAFHLISKFAPQEYDSPESWPLIYKLNDNYLSNTYNYLSQLQYSKLIQQDPQIQSIILQLLHANDLHLRMATIQFIRTAFKDFPPDFMGQIFEQMVEQPQLIVAFFQNMDTYGGLSEAYIDKKLALRFAFYLADKPLYCVPYVRLLLRSNNEQAILAGFEQLSQRNSLHTDVLQTTLQTFHKEAFINNYSYLEQAWAEHPDARLRWLSAQLWLKRTVEKNRLDREGYERYINDPDPAVASSVLLHPALLSLLNPKSYDD